MDIISSALRSLYFKNAATVLTNYKNEEPIDEQACRLLKLNMMEESVKSVRRLNIK